MAKAKNERNQQFIRAWKEEGLSDKQLQKRFGLSEGGMRGLKARLRAKDSALYVEKPPGLTKVEKDIAKASGGLIQFAGKIKKASRKVTSTQTSTSTKRMTFWLPGAMIERIKSKAAREGKTASQIARELLSKYL